MYLKKDINMSKLFVSQNITMAANGVFTYATLLTPTEAKTTYNITVPDNVMVTSDGLLWVKFNSAKTAAQIGYTDIEQTQTSNVFAWSPYDKQGTISLNAAVNASVTTNTTLSTVQCEGATLTMISPLGNAIVKERLVTDGDILDKESVYETPIYLLVANGATVNAVTWMCATCGGYSTISIMPPLKCPSCMGTNFITTT